MIYNNHATELMTVLRQISLMSFLNWAPDR